MVIWNTKIMHVSLERKKLKRSQRKKMWQPQRSQGLKVDLQYNCPSVSHCLKSGAAWWTERLSCWDFLCVSRLNLTCWIWCWTVQKSAFIPWRPELQHFLDTSSQSPGSPEWHWLLQWPSETLSAEKRRWRTWKMVSCLYFFIQTFYIFLYFVICASPQSLVYVYI